MCISLHYRKLQNTECSQYTIIRTFKYILDIYFAVMQLLCHVKAIVLLTSTCNLVGTCNVFMNLLQAPERQGQIGLITYV